MLSVYLSLDGGVYPRGVSIAVLVYLFFLFKSGCLLVFITGHIQ